MKPFAGVVLFLLILGVCAPLRAQYSGYCPLCVVTTSTPGTGIAHFAGGNQTATSSKILPADIDFSSLTGLVRGGNPPTAAELSGDATTNLSNVVKVTGINNLPVPLSATVVGTNASRQLVTASLTGTQSKVVVSSGLSVGAGVVICDDGSGNATESGCVQSTYVADQSWASGSTVALLGSPVQLIPNGAPTGLYRIDAEIAETSAGTCPTVGTVSLRFGYTDNETGQTYSLSDSRSRMVWLAADAGSGSSASFNTVFSLSTSITLSSAEYSYKVIYFKSMTGTDAQIQAYQEVGNMAGCLNSPHFQTTVTATRVK